MPDRPALLPPVVVTLVLTFIAGACNSDGGATPPTTGSPPVSSPTAGPTSTPSAPPPGSPSTTPSPSTAPPPPVATPSPSPAAIETAAQAAALVLASEPLFASVTPLTPELIGQCCWYEVQPSVDPGWQVSVTVGWGDCFAGCIDRHTWLYHVTPEREVSLIEEAGADPPPDVVPGGGPERAQVRLHFAAGPTCPVETQPPDPDCAPRPVGNAEVVVRDHLGTAVARGLSDADGLVELAVPAGVYVVEPLPVEGLLGTPEPVAFSVVGGGQADLFFGYDTGIR